MDNYEIRYLGTTGSVPYGNRTEFISSVEVYRDGELLDTISPNRAFYPSFNMASTRAAIRSTPVEDFYVVPSENLWKTATWGFGSCQPADLVDVGCRTGDDPGYVIALWPEPSRVPARAPARANGCGHAESGSYGMKAHVRSETPILS